MKPTPPVTIFAIPKAFRFNIGVIQRNAIQSWKALLPSPRILLLADDEGTAETAREFGLEHIPHVARSEFGTPLLDSAFALAHEAVREGWMTFLNSDIILTSDFMPAIGRVDFDDFLITGRRSDALVFDPIDFKDPSWEAALKERVSRTGGLSGPTALDYFVFPHHMFPKVPPFAVGKGWWDHWFPAEALRRGATVIDATPAVLAVHQRHDYLATQEARRNQAWLGLPVNTISTEVADYVLDAGVFSTPSRRVHLETYLELKAPHRGDLVRWRKAHAVLNRFAARLPGRVRATVRNTFATVFHGYEETRRARPKER